MINLPERTDRLATFQQEAASLFGNRPVLIQPGIKDANTWHGIAKAHMACINTAKQAGWDNVLIMEDDLYIPAKGKDMLKLYIDAAFSKLPDEWDILLGGVYHARTLDKHNKYWYKVSEFCALHFYIVNASCYDKLLNWDKTNHYDRWVSKQNLKCFVPSRFFAIQYDGYSDNVAKVTDYNSTCLNKFNILK